MTGSTQADDTRGKRPAEAVGANAAEGVAVALLDAMERRALGEAEKLLAPGFQMVFPGAARYTSLEEMVAGAKGRYQRVAKMIDGVESFERASAGASSTVADRAGSTSGGSPGEVTTVVYVRGTLYGVNSHGVEFSGVRFVDRFEIARGLIRRQDVWNDLAESGVLARRR